MRIFYRIFCVLLLIAGLLGCSAAVVIKEGKNNLDIGTVIQKATITTDGSKVESDTVCNTVGVVINISNYLEMKMQRTVYMGAHSEIHVMKMRTEEFAYQEVSDKIISMFKAIDIDAFVVHNENDSRLKNVCYLLHVCYDEEPMNPFLTSAVSDASIENMGMALTDDIVSSDKIIMRNYYKIVIVDVKRGKEKHYNNLKTAVFAIRDMLQK